MASNLLINRIYVTLLLYGRGGNHELIEERKAANARLTELTSWKQFCSAVSLTLVAAQGLKDEFESRTVGDIALAYILNIFDLSSQDVGTT